MFGNKLSDSPTNPKARACGTVDRPMVCWLAADSWRAHFLLIRLVPEAYFKPSTPVLRGMNGMDPHTFPWKSPFFVSTPLTPCSRLAFPGRRRVFGRQSLGVPQFRQDGGVILCFARWMDGQGMRSFPAMRTYFRRGSARGPSRSTSGVVVTRFFDARARSNRGTH